MCWLNCADAHLPPFFYFGRRHHAFALSKDCTRLCSNLNVFTVKGYITINWQYVDPNIVVIITKIKWCITELWEWSKKKVKWVENLLLEKCFNVVCSCYPGIKRINSIEIITSLITILHFICKFAINIVI